MPNDIFHTAKQLEELRKLGLISDMRQQDGGDSYFLSPDQDEAAKQNYDEVLNQTLLKKPYDSSLPLALGQASTQGARIGDQGGSIPSDEEVGLYDSPAALPSGRTGILAGKTDAAPARQLASRAPSPKPAPEAAPQTAPLEGSMFSGLDFGKSDLANQQALQDAQKRQNDLQFLANMNRSFAQVAQGLAQSKPLDTSVADALERQGKQAVPDYLQQVEFQKQDPASAYSKGLKDYFKTKLGIEIRGDASAAELEKIMPFAVREYEAKEERKRLEIQSKESREARKHEREEDRQFKERQGDLDRQTRKEIAEMGLAAKGDKEGASAEKDKKKTVQSFRQEAIKGELGKQYANYKLADRAEKSIEQFIKNPTGYTDYATLMIGLKSLQGDNSVIRAEEMKLGQKAGSLWQKVKNSIDSLATGNTLQPEQRRYIKLAVQALKETSKQQYAASVTPLKLQADQEQLPLTQVFDPEIAKMFEASDKTEPSAKEDQKVKQYADAHFQGDYEKARIFLEEKRGYKSGQ